MFKLFRAHSENKELTLKVESLESEKLKINHELGLLQNELNQTRETMGKLQIKHAEENQSQVDVEARMDKAREAYNGLQLQLQTQQQENTEAQTKIAEQQAQIDQLQLQLSESKIETVQDNPEQEAKIAEQSQRIAELENELAQFAQNQLKLEMQNKKLASEIEDKAQQSPPAATVTKEAKAPENISIAVIDDSITTRTLMKKILQSARYNVSVAKDGLEGKALIEKENPDIIVTDIEMPNMDGFELTRWVKSSHSQPETPVIMITSLADEDFQARGKEAGASSFITKNNFNQQTFLAIIEQNLSN